MPFALFKLLFLGCTTPLRVVTIFCAHAGVGILFMYFYMITFTVACLTYSGRREKANKHPVTFRELPLKSQRGEFTNGKLVLIFYILEPSSNSLALL